MAFNVLDNNLSEEMIDAGEFDILEPEYANFSGAAPLMLKADDLEQEFACALAYVRELYGSEPGRKSCIAICGKSLYQIQKFSEKIGLNVLDGDISIEEADLFVSDLEHTKGFEFDTMIIINCNKGVVPDPREPEKEQFRDLARFYVAMTRAKNQLVVSYSDVLSTYLENSLTLFLQDKWSAYVEKSGLKLYGVPPSLNEIRHDEEHYDELENILNMSGPEFLYTEQAIELDGLLIDKLRQLITDRPAPGNDNPAEWSTIRKAKMDTEKSGKARKLFGPEGIKKFRELLDALENPR